MIFIDVLQGGMFYATSIVLWIVSSDILIMVVIFCSFLSSAIFSMTMEGVHWTTTNFLATSYLVLSIITLPL